MAAGRNRYCQGEETAEEEGGGEGALWNLVDSRLE